MGRAVPKDDTIADSLEDLLLVDGKKVDEVLVVLEHLVYVVGERLPLGLEHRVVNCLASLHIFSIISKNQTSADKPLFVGIDIRLATNRTLTETLTVIKRTPSR